MLIVIVLSVVMLSVILLSVVLIVIVLSDYYDECHAECLDAD
jgi:hypothetical protein